MDNWQPSTLSWSCSSKRHFEDCKRHYFYHRFWGQDPKLRWRLYEMRCITTLKMLQGAVVHEVIAEALNSIRNGSPMSLDAAKRAVTDKMWEKYKESENKLWHRDNRPSDRKINTITNLLEHYYRFPNVLDRARCARDTGWLCIENLFSSDVWGSIIRSSFDEWKELEADNFPSFDLDGIKVYSRIDFAFASEVPTIIDWKTGMPTKEDRTQLIVYALYGQHKWGWKPSETTLMAVYLQPQIVVEKFCPTTEDVERTEQAIKSSFAEMMEFEPAYGPADIANYPITEDIRHCHWCRYQGICEGARRLNPDRWQLSVEPPDEEV